MYQGKSHFEVHHSFVFVDKEIPYVHFKGKVKLIIKDLVIISAFVAFLIAFIMQPTTISGRSMQPSLQDADQILLEKVTGRFTDYQRFDIVVFKYHQDETTYYIKRIIGMEGDVIDIRDGLVYVNNETLEEPIDLGDIELMGDVVFPITVPKDSYFVMGDNRNRSVDSRFSDVGFVKKDEILGRGFFRVYPFENFGFLE